MNFRRSLGIPWHLQFGLEADWTSRSWSLGPRSAKDVLLFRFRLPGAPGFIRVIQMLTEEVGYGMEEVMS